MRNEQVILNSKFARKIVNNNGVAISTVAEAWNLAMFGNNRLFAFCISSRGLDDILTGRATSTTSRATEDEDDSVTVIAMVYTRD